MAGILDFLFGPQAAAGQVYDPRMIRQQAISQALMGAGAGLLSGQNWQQGGARALVGAGQGAQQGRESAMQSQLFSQQMAGEQQKQDEQAKRREFAMNWAKQNPDNPMAQAFAQAYPEEIGGIAADQFKPQDLVNVGEGGMLVDPTTHQSVFENPKTDAPPSMVKEYEFAQSQGYRGSYFDFVTDRAKAGASNININPTDAQASAGGYYNRMTQANQIIDGLAIKGFSPSLAESTAANIPGVGNFLVGADQQQFNQAKRDFVNAVLRRESGAVISPSEFSNAEQQYFPQPGDSPEVVAQKRRNRLNAIESLKVAGGPAVQMFDQPAAGPEAAPQDAAPTPERPKLESGKTVVGGYLYLGGNPNEQSSWRKVQ